MFLQELRDTALYTRELLESTSNPAYTGYEAMIISQRSVTETLRNGFDVVMIRHLNG